MTFCTTNNKMLMGLHVVPNCYLKQIFFFFQFDPASVHGMFIGLSSCVRHLNNFLKIRTIMGTCPRHVRVRVSDMVPTPTRRPWGGVRASLSKGIYMGGDP